MRHAGRVSHGVHRHTYTIVTPTLQVGLSAGLAVVLFLVGRARGGSVARSLSVALLAIPTGLAVGVAAGLLDVGFWVTYGVYLAASTVLVWWFAGGPRIAE